MGSIRKLVLGFMILFIGIVISFEAYTNKLIDIILIVGLFMILAGIVLLVNYFVDNPPSKTQDLVKNYVNGNVKMPNISFGSQQQVPEGPLRVNNSFNDYDYDYDEEFYGDNVKETEDVYDYDEYYSNPRQVLQTRNLEEETVNFGNNLNFTPNYDKPLKVTRAPKKRSKSFFEDDYVVDNSYDKSESIKRALNEETEFSNDLRTPDQREARDIKIDINNPESLPIPKLLNSFIITNDEIITSKEAFDYLSTTIKKEVMLEIPSLNDLSDRFLSHIPTIYSRVIIEDFDVSNISYMILVASLLKQGVHIKTMPKINTINLITDDSYALILSKGRRNTEVEYGAIYDDRIALSDIRGAFEKSWDLAKDLDENIILRYMEAGAM